MSTPLRTGFLALFLSLLFGAYYYVTSSPIALNYLAPTNGTQIYEGQLESEGKGNPREDWQKMIHRAAPDVDWRAKDNKTRFKNHQNRTDKNQLAVRTNNSYANGNLQGSWHERGSNNQAGSLEEVEYVASLDKLYGISAGGTIWKGDLDGSNWTPVNETLQFDKHTLKVVPLSGGGHRIIAAIGKIIHYSDDDGVNWTASTGLNFQSTWGYPLKIEALNNAENSIYYLVRTWQFTPSSGAKVELYYSNNKGQSFSRIAEYVQWNHEWISLWSPPNSSEAYLLVNGSNLYFLNGSTVGFFSSNTQLPSTQEVMLTSSKDGGNNVFYVLVARSQLYKSTNSGFSWSYVGAPPVSSWEVGIYASPTDHNNLFMGAVDCYRSTNGGSSWSKINEWWQYYSNIDLLHADIMDFKAFEKTDGTDFILVANHGGLHISYDDLATTTNISTSGLNIGQYYDVRTDPTDPDYFYAGSQDQGHQRSSEATNLNKADFTQVISGDYGHFAFSGNNTSLWSIYPGGFTTFYPNPQSGSYATDFDIIGSNPAVSDWITPTAEIPNTPNHEIYIAGGNITGGSGSYLIKLTATNSGGWSISASQFNYDFRANSISGTGTISAIEVSPLDVNKIYVATSDGTFFYSNNAGASWTKSTVAGPTQYWLYGSCILASDIDPNLVWFTGSGYSNPPVYKSVNGGATFTAMNNGLPSTLVQEIDANPTETLLYAATEVGAYVYVVAEDTWYDMMQGLPQQNYYSVEYTQNDCVQFGSYGRGIWDFQPSQQPVLPVEWLSFEAQKTENALVDLSWSTASEFNNEYFEIQKSTDGQRFESIGEVNTKGNGFETNDYKFLDRFPINGNNYYRIKQVDFDGTFEYSNIRQVSFEDKAIAASVFPNPVSIGQQLSVSISEEGTYKLGIFDETGQAVLEQQILERDAIDLNEFSSGNYFYRITNENESKVLTGKVMVMK